MSLSLLNKELEKAFDNLDNSTKKKKSVKQESGSLKSQLGPERHGVKKRLNKLKSKNKPKLASKLRWKFAEFSKSEPDFTEESLLALQKLDKLARPVSEDILDHHRKEKRQVKVENKLTKSKFEEEEGTVFTDEDFERLSKEYFLHSATAPVTEDS